jgi:Xaa-Pro aminopeptidase
MAYPLDQEKWRRVRETLERNDLDAVVVRAPDNVLYLTNYWTMKGYDLAIFPREGEPTLLVIEPQFREAQRTAWNKDVRFFPFYHPKDPRPPMIRAVEMAVEVLKERRLTRRVGIKLRRFAIAWWANLPCIGRAFTMRSALRARKRLMPRLCWRRCA